MSSVAFCCVLLIYCYIEQVLLFRAATDKLPQSLVMGYAMFMLTLIFALAFSLHLWNWKKVGKTAAYFIFDKLAVPYVLLTWRVKYQFSELVQHPALLGVGLVMALCWIAMSGAIVPQMLGYLGSAIGTSNDPDAVGGDAVIERRVDVAGYDLMSFAIIFMPILFWHVKLIFQITQP